MSLIRGYAMQSEASLKERQSQKELKNEWNIYGVDDSVVCLGYIDGHVGRHIDGSDGVHGEYSVGRRNLGRRILLVLMDKWAGILMDLMEFMVSTV